MANNVSEPTFSGSNASAVNTSLQAESSSSGSPICAESSKILALPPGRAEIQSNIRTINMKCFLMLCDMHRGMLARLIPAPSGLLVAARNVLQSPCDPGNPGDAAIWADALAAYARSFSASRQQVLAAARLQGAMDLGRKAAGAIDEITNILPAFLAEATVPKAGLDALLASAKRLGDAAMKLEAALIQLLDMVELAAARARQADDPGPVSRIGKEIAD